MSNIWGSLRNRVALVASGVTLVLLVFVAVLLLVAQQRQLDDAVDTALRAEVADVQRELTITFARFEGRRPRANQLDAAQLERFVRGSSNNFQLVSRNGDVRLAAGRFSQDTPIVDTDELFAPGTDGTFQTVVDPSGNRFRVVSTDVGAQRALIVGYSLADVDEAQRALRRTLAVVLPSLAVLLGVLIWFFVGRALDPVEQMRREVDGISAQDLDARVSTPDTTELSALATTMNSMLSRLEASSSKQQQFVSDASHELRSPLTGIRSQLEVNLAHPEAPGRAEAEADILQETIRMQALVEDLLALARSDQGRQHLPMELVDLDDVVLTEVERQRRSTEITIETTAVSAAQVTGNVDQLTRLTRNLLTNGLRHGTHRVTVSVRQVAGQVGGTVELAIFDDGPGVPEDVQAGIFERFTRSADARDRDSGGSGLGLAICRTIAEGHGGSIHLEPPNRFVVILPMAETPQT
ncbi:MAG: ATP-binding protein [Acidimicrobiales bacterium]